jgi:hypothetical protein
MLGKTHARHLAPFAGKADLLKAIAKEFKRDLKSGEAPSVEAFRNDIRRVALNCTRKLDGDDGWDQRSGARVPRFTPTAEERDQLDVSTVEDWTGKDIDVACNVKLWDKLQKAFREKWTKEHPATKPATTKASKGTKGDGSKPKKLTPAQQKAAAEAAVKKRERDLEEWVALALSYSISKELGKADDPDLLRFALWCNLEEIFLPYDSLRTLLGKHVNAPLGKILQWSTGEIVEAACKMLSAAFWDAGPSPIGTIPIADLVPIAKHLGVEIESAWLNGDLGPLYETYWHGVPEDRVADLARELKIDVAGGATADAIRKACLKAMPREDIMESGPPLPRELRDAIKRARKAVK